MEYRSTRNPELGTRNCGASRRDERVSRRTKRAIDIIGSAAGLVVAAPLLLLAALAIQLDSPGPALFRQRRIGQHGVPFTLYKLRGMHVDARLRFPELYQYHYTDADLDRLHFHAANDPRVTRLGRFLRRTSIDELPNLWNVLRGEMSLVGPRPEIEEMMPYYDDARDLILSVKPGLTSLAKASGRDYLTFRQTLQLDVAYVRNHSLARDRQILLWTLLDVLRCRYVC
ncbi:MAG: sugar transferase [Dehalococcoidia bacterium]